MKNDFEKIIDRSNTNSEKYDFKEEWGVLKDAIPMWVADMDFQAPPCVRARMQKDIDLGIFGYSEPKEEYYLALTRWYEKRFHWRIEKEWVVKTPGVVFGIAMAIRALTNPKDAILIQPPVYYPFKKVISDNDRTVVINPLVNVNGHYEINFDEFERKIKEEQVKLFLFCSPHNPGGRVWKEWELKKILEVCKKYNVYIISDEIHADFVYVGNSHIVLATLAKDYLDHIITCTSPSKTFNIAGLQISNIVICDEAIRKCFQKEMLSVAYIEVGMLSISACQAAYEGGEEWLEELLLYLKENIKYVRNFLKKNLPRVKMMEPEGTYLLWLDFSEYGYEPEELDEKMLKEAKLWLDEGSIFGDEGKFFERINIACPRSILVEAMERMAKVFG